MAIDCVKNNSILFKKDSKGKEVCDLNQTETTFKYSGRKNLDYHAQEITDKLTKIERVIDLKALGIEAKVTGYSLDRRCYIGEHGFGLDHEDTWDNKSSALIGIKIDISGKGLNVTQSVGVKRDLLERSSKSYASLIHQNYETLDHYYTEDSRIRNYDPLKQEDIDVKQVNVEDILKGAIALDFMKKNISEKVAQELPKLSGGKLKSQLKNLSLSELALLDKKKSEIEKNFYDEFAKAGKGESVDFEKLIKDNFNCELNLDEILKASFDKENKKSLQNQLSGLSKEEIVLE